MIKKKVKSISPTKKKPKKKIKKKVIEKVKKKRGRPSKKDQLPDSIFKEFYLMGKTDKQVAEIVDVSEVTLNAWKKKHDNFLKSLKEWKLEADKKVEQSLYKRALGFKYDEVTYDKTKTTDNKTKIVNKLVVPDVTAQIFWLKNRQPKDWRDKQIVGIIETNDADFRNEFFGLKPKKKD